MNLELARRLIQRVHPAVKHIFYSDVPEFLHNTPEDEKLIILVDFNARVGKALRPGKESLVDTALVTLMTTGASCSSSAQSANSPSPT